MRRQIRLTVWMLLTVLAATTVGFAAEAAKRPSNTADKPQVELWPVGKAPGQKAGKPTVNRRWLTGIYDPWMAVHLPPKDKANGAAVVICPGGGYGCRPDFAILIYAVISMKKGVTHGGSRNNLLGGKPDEKLVTLMSNELQVTAKTPPTFLVHSTDDRAVPPANSKLFHEACKKAGVPSELRIYKQGGHGYGLGRKGHDSAEWPARCAEWLKARKLLDKKKESAPKPKAAAPKADR